MVGGTKAGHTAPTGPEPRPSHPPSSRPTQPASLTSIAAGPGTAPSLPVSGHSAALPSPVYSSGLLRPESLHAPAQPAHCSVRLQCRLFLSFFFPLPVTRPLRPPLSLSTRAPSSCPLWPGEKIVQTSRALADEKRSGLRIPPPTGTHTEEQDGSGSGGRRRGGRSLCRCIRDEDSVTLFARPGSLFRAAAAAEVEGGGIRATARDVTLK